MDKTVNQQYAVKPVYEIIPGDLNTFPFQTCFCLMQVLPSGQKEIHKVNVPCIVCLWSKTNIRTSCYMCTLYCYWAVHIFNFLSFFSFVCFIFAISQLEYSVHILMMVWFISFPCVMGYFFSDKFQEAQYGTKLYEQKL